MSERIIFLDIDGVMIPERAFIWDARARYKQLLDPMCVRVLRRIIKETGAKIVFNSAHNSMLQADAFSPGLIERFREKGLGAHIHEDGVTMFPNLRLDKLSAIRGWLFGRSIESWVALDDVQINDDRAIMVDPKHGLGLDEYQHARRYLLGEKMRRVRM